MRSSVARIPSSACLGIEPIFSISAAGPARRPTSRDQRPSSVGLLVPPDAPADQAPRLGLPGNAAIRLELDHCVAGRIGTNRVSGLPRIHIENLANSSGMSLFASGRPSPTRRSWNAFRRRRVARRSRGRRLDDAFDADGVSLHRLRYPS